VFGVAVAVPPPTVGVPALVPSPGAPSKGGTGTMHSATAMAGAALATIVDVSITVVVDTTSACQQHSQINKVF